MSPLQPKTKAEFALQFCPKHWSEGTMRRWLSYEISKDAALMDKLRAAGYRKSQKILTIKQQQIILQHWGCHPD